MADIGELIGGYKLRALLHPGQKSQVFEVVEPHSNRHFAMKLLLPEAAAEEVEREVLFHEAEVGIKLTHPNVVRYFKVNRSKESPHFIMEFFPSGSLRSRLQQKDFKYLRQNARKIFREAATGLAYMNASGYVHRDVKPDNILANPLGETKIIDFAITKKSTKGGLFRRKQKPQGTPSYMSPEQIKDDPQDARADIYSFGCTLFELTTGKKPFTGASQQDLLTKHFTDKPPYPSSLNKDVTEEFSALVVKCMAKKREDRPASFHDFLIGLQRVKIYKDELTEQEQAEADAKAARLAAAAEAKARAEAAERKRAEDPTPDRPPPPPRAADAPFDPDDIDIDAL